MSYDYQENIDKVEKAGIKALISWLIDRRCVVVDLTGTTEDFSHRGDLLITHNGVGKYAQVKVRREKYWNYHKKDDLIWITTGDPRVEDKGLAGTSIYNDLSNLFITAYVVKDKVVKVIYLWTQPFKVWLKEHEERYELKQCSIRGSMSYGRMVKVGDIPANLKMVVV